MAHFSYDFLVLGGGSAGYAAARTARQFTQRVGIVDGGAELGGLCILRGCMPSKTLIYSAEVLHLAQHGAAFGLEIPTARMDFAALHRRKLATIGEFAAYRQGQLADDRFTLHRSQARFTGPNVVALENGDTLLAEKILVATGSSVNWPAVPGIDLPGIWTSDDVLELAEDPGSVIVLGGGVVACELAQFLARSGTRVTQIQRSPRLLKEATAEASEVVEAAFRAEGMEVLTDTQLESVERGGEGFIVTFRHGGAVFHRTARHVMNALGRRPNTDHLDAAAGGFQLRRSGHVEVNRYQQTANPHVYAAGDVAGPHEIVHVAIMQGEVAARHALGQPTGTVNYDTVLGVIFTDPQVAYVGLTPEEMARRGLEVVTAKMTFDDHGKSILMEAKRGFVRCWAERGSGRLLAAECVGKDASELIHAMSVGVHLGATVQQLAAAHWYHPTLSEIWTYPLEDCRDALA